MQVSNVSFLQTYSRSTIGSYIRGKVLNRIWPERNPNQLVQDVAINNTQPLARLSYPLELDKFTLLRQLVKFANESPNKILYVANGKSYTAKEIYSNIKRLGSGLKSIGIQEGEKVALMALPHERELFESFFALEAIGAVPVLINFLNPPETVGYMFARSDAKTLIVGRHYKQRLGATRLAIGGLLERVITFGRPDYSEAPWNLATRLRVLIGNPFFYKYESLIKSPELKDDELLLNPNSDSPSLQLFTSGTSGTPKLLTYNYDMLARAAETTTKRFDIKKDDRWLFAVPFYHLAGLIVFCGGMSWNNTTALAEIPRVSKPDTIQKALNALIKNKITIFPGVPRIIEPVLEEAFKQGLLLKDLRTVFSGAAPLTPKLIDLIQKLNDKRSKQNIEPINLINFYASTECGPISSTVKPITQETINSLGVPFDDVEVKIGGSWDEELLVKVPFFPPDLPKNSLTQDGFFKTGDEVKIENDHSLIYLDRLTERLNVHGEKLSPLLIQRQIEKYPYVKEVHVFGVPKPNDGSDIVCAVLMPKDNTTINVDEVRKFLEYNLTTDLRAFIPRVIFIEPNGIPDTLIRGPGKTPRRLFRKVYGERAIREYNSLKNII